MEKRKLLITSIFGILLSFFMLSSVSAYYSSANTILDSVVNAWEPVLRAILGGDDWSGMFLFEKLLLLIILICLVYISIGTIPIFNNQKGVKWIISIVVPLIGVRYMNYEWIAAVILQYQALAIILTTILPFALFVFFLYNLGWDSSTLRRIGWSLFIVVYFGLWSTTQLAANATMYLWTIAVAIVCFIFDKKIQKYFTKNSGKEAEENIKADMAIEAWKKYQQALEVYEKSGGTNKLAERQAKKYHDFLKKHGLL